MELTASRYCCISFMAASMGFQPVGGGVGLHLQRHAVGERQGGAHGLCNLRDEVVLVLVQVNEEFVVNLHDETAAAALQ